MAAGEGEGDSEGTAGGTLPDATPADAKPAGAKPAGAKPVDVDAKAGVQAVPGPEMRGSEGGTTTGVGGRQGVLSHSGTAMTPDRAHSAASSTMTGCQP